MEAEVEDEPEGISTYSWKHLPGILAGWGSLIQRTARSLYHPIVLLNVIKSLTQVTEAVALGRELLSKETSTWWWSNLLLPPSHYLGYPNSQESLQQPGECPLLPYIWELSVEGVAKDDSPSSVVSIPFLLAQEWNGERGVCPCSSWG